MRGAPVDPHSQAPDGEPLELDDELAGLDAFLATADDALVEVAEQTTYGEVVLEDLIRRQLTLSLSVAGAFLLLLFGLPLFNLLFPDLAALSVLGLPLSWLLLAVLIYPVLWVLAYYYVATSRKYEREFDELVR
jgi:uncharacterized membrane protein (DUF485 family)